MPLAVVTGLAAEARIAAPGVATIVGAGRGDRLAIDLEAAIANGATHLLSFGVAGALAPQLLPGDLIVARSVVDDVKRLACDAAWSAAMIEFLKRSSSSSQAKQSHPATVAASEWLRFARNDGFQPITDAAGVPPDVAGVEAVVADPAAKAALFAESGAAAVDMESAIVARAAARHRLPFAVLRAIADPAHRLLPPAALAAMRADGGVDVAAVLAALAGDPSQGPALARLALDSRKAFATLIRARALLGPRFASVDFGEL